MQGLVVLRILAGELHQADQQRDIDRGEVFLIVLSHELLADRARDSELGLALGGRIHGTALRFADRRHLFQSSVIVRDWLHVDRSVLHGVRAVPEIFDLATLDEEVAQGPPWVLAFAGREEFPHARADRRSICMAIP